MGFRSRRWCAGDWASAGDCARAGGWASAGSGQAGDAVTVTVGRVDLSILRRTFRPSLSAIFTSTKNSMMIKLATFLMYGIGCKGTGPGRRLEQACVNVQSESQAFMQLRAPRAILRLRRKTITNYRHFPQHDSFSTGICEKQTKKQRRLGWFTYRTG